MIIDRLKNAGLYAGIGGRIASALGYLQRGDILKKGFGRFEIEGMDLYALVQRYETKPKEKGAWEAHRKYVDVQYMLKGSELMGYAGLESLKAVAYDEERDSAALEGNGSFIEVGEGDFIIFTPYDAHMPGIAISVPETVEKIVLKLRLETL